MSYNPINVSTMDMKMLLLPKATAAILGVSAGYAPCTRDELLTLVRLLDCGPDSCKPEITADLCRAVVRMGLVDVLLERRIIERVDGTPSKQYGDCQHDEGYYPWYQCDTLGGIVLRIKHK